MTRIYCSDSTIETSFPTDVYNSYLKKIDCKSNDELDDVKKEIVFTFAYRDFKSGKLTLDNFSDIANCLLNQLDIVGKTSSRFGSVLNFAGELNYYVRNVDKTLVWFLEEIDKYFIKDRPGLLDSIKKYDD